MAKGKQKIIFRADGNAEIGLGHVMRTLALADILKDDYTCVFASRFNNKLIDQEVMQVYSNTISLPKDNKLHFNFFLEILQGNEIVVLDNYFFTTDYQRKIRAKGCKLVCIDDLADKHFVADIIINHSGGITPEDYSCEKYTQIYLGPKYAMLRQEFFHYKPKKINFNSILIALGSAFDYKNLLQLIYYLQQFKFLKIDIIVNSKLVEDLDTHNNSELKTIYFHYNLDAKTLKTLLDNHSIAICSASSIAYECMASGMLVFLKKTIDNQKRLFDYLVSNDLGLDFNNFNLKTININTAQSFMKKTTFNFL